MMISSLERINRRAMNSILKTAKKNLHDAKREEEILYQGLAQTRDRILRITSDEKKSDNGDLVEFFNDLETKGQEFVTLEINVLIERYRRCIQLITILESISKESAKKARIKRVRRYRVPLREVKAPEEERQKHTEEVDLRLQNHTPKEIKGVNVQPREIEAAEVKSELKPKPRVPMQREKSERNDSEKILESFKFQLSQISLGSRENKKYLDEAKRIFHEHRGEIEDIKFKRAMEEICSDLLEVGAMNKTNTAGLPIIIREELAELKDLTIS